jgi:hypothetical protein
VVLLAAGLVKRLLGGALVAVGVDSGSGAVGGVGDALLDPLGGGLGVVGSLRFVSVTVCL